MYLFYFILTEFYLLLYINRILPFYNIKLPPTTTTTQYPEVECLSLGDLA